MIADLRTFLENFRPDGYTTFVGIVPDGSTVAATFSGIDAREAMDWLERQNSGRRGVYFTVNATSPGLRRKPSKSDVTAISAMWADIDPLDGAGRPWDQERERLLALAAELEALDTPPSLIVDSGNGVQPIWLLQDPIEASEEYRHTAEVLCARFEAALGAKGTHNVERLLRVPGSRNFPNEKKRRLGRGETQARILHAPWRRYSWRDLEELAARLDAHPPEHAVPVVPQDAARPGSPADGVGLNLPSEPPEPIEPERLESVRAGDPGVLELARYDGDQSRQDMALASLARRLGWPPVDAWRLILAVRSDRKACRRDYIQRTLRRAYAGQRDVDPAARGQAAASQVAPLDLFGDTALAGTPEMTEDMLPDNIAAFAKDEAERLGVELAMVALPCLAVTAAAIRDQWKIQPKRNDARWKEAARLWVTIVADSGSLKTPAMNSAVAPLKEVEFEWAEQDAIEIEDFELQNKVYTHALDHYARETAKGKHVERPTKPVRPRLRRLVTSDATTASLSEILRDNPGGVLSFQDELSGWLGSFDAYRNGGRDREDWLELYNGGSRTIDRVRRGKCAVPNWSACLLGGIQPEPMRRVAKTMGDDGLAQRFIVAHTARTGEGQDRLPDYDAINAYSELIRRLVNSTPDPDAGPIVLSEEAQRQRALVQRVTYQIMALPSTSPAFRAHLSKWHGLFARLLLTFHLADSDGQPALMVSGRTAERVARFALDYLLPNAARFYADFFGLSETAMHARWVAGLILAHGLESIRARDIYRAYNELRGDLDELTRTLAILDVAGWLDPVEDVRGRPTRVWMVNPLVHTVFAARAAEERKRRAAERERVQEAVRDLGLAGEDAA